MGKFITKKDPDALAEFYQAEDLLRIIAIHPIIFNMFMDKVEPDADEVTESTKLLSTEETKFNVKSLGMEVSFELIQEEEEIDGETKPVTFMRHERFIDWVPILSQIELPWGGYRHRKNYCKILLWDQTWTYGFKRLNDGTYEVYHHGEKFLGPWPVRMIVFFHQYYVMWACEKHINGQAFGDEDLMDRAQEELACIPLHVFKQFIGNLTEEKIKSIETLKKSGASSERIAKAEETLQKLKALEESKQSTISVAMVPMAKPGALKRTGTVKMIPQDTETREVLEEAMKDGNRAVLEVVNDPALEFKKRSTLKRTASKAMDGEIPRSDSLKERLTKHVTKVAQVATSAAAPATA
jgi:hypothetical protein